MKKWLSAAVVTSILMTSATLHASADVKYSPQTVKKIASKGQLPKTAGKVGMTYGTLKKTVSGHLEETEVGVMYYAKNATTVYLFPKYSKKQMKTTTKVMIIDRTFKQSSFTKPLTATVMKNTFNKKVWIGTNDYLGSAVFKAAYKSNTDKYVMHKTHANGTVTLTVGTKNNLYRSGFWLNG